MSQIKCPHCGFLNFAISAYCGRCERPIKVETAVPVTTPSTSAQVPIRAMPPRAPKSQLVAPPARPTAPLAPMEIAVPKAAEAIEKTVIDRSFSRPTLKTEDVQRAAPQPTPSAPASLFKRLTPKGPGPKSLDAELTEISAPPAPATKGPVLEPSNLAARRSTVNEGATQISAASAELWHVAAATLLDAALVGCVGFAIAACEVLVFDVHWPTDAVGLDALAIWLHLYPRTAVRAVVGMLLIGFGYNVWGAHSGRTLGRAVVGLRLVKREGTQLSWLAAVLRGASSLVSVGLFGAGYFWMVVDAQHRTWADLVSRAVIVRR